MAKFYDITLTVHGPYKTVEQFKNEISDAQNNYGEKRIIYMATRWDHKIQGDKFVYIGITGAKILRDRFKADHTIRQYEHNWERLWVAYFSTEKIDRTRIGRHEGRLKFAETVLINYFHPELNVDELHELTYPDGTNETIGGGSHFEGTVTLKWRSEDNRATTTPLIRKIPNKIHLRFNKKLGAEYDYVFAYT